MITDARVLDPEFIPNDVVHRDDEINRLTNTLRPIIDGKTAEPAFLHGPSGAGKTCIAQYTLERLREATIDLNTQYVNCWEANTRYKTLYRILDGIDQTLDIHRQSSSTDVLLRRLNDYTGPAFVVILDEVDHLQEKDILYELDRLRGVSLVLVANDDTEVFSELNNRVTSRFQTFTRIPFTQYTQSELTTILNDRVRWGLQQDAITETQLEQIARSADGDARVAIEVLRVAATLASQAGTDTVTNVMVMEAVSEAETEIQQQILTKLTTDQTLLYEIIAEHGEIASSDLYEQYEDSVENPRSRRTLRNYLSKLVHYNLVEAHGDNQGRVYSDATKQ